MTHVAVRPHHVLPQLLPVRPGPHHSERTGSYLIRISEANHCPPWSFLRLLGHIPSANRVDLVPAASVTMNHAALTRLAVYLGKPADQLTRALPWIAAEERWDEPTVLIRRPARKYLRSCELCEKRAGGASLMPDPRPLQFTCERHRAWLITDETIELHRVPEITKALAVLRRIRGRHGDDVAHAHYRLIRDYITDDWRGQGWHNHLTRRWTARQRLMHPTAHTAAEFVRSRTHHWSMLPETVALTRITARADHPSHHRPPTAADLSNALKLADYWTSQHTESLDPWTTFHPLITA